MIFSIGGRAVAVFDDGAIARETIAAFVAVNSVRRLLVDDRGCWRDNVNGADVIEAVSRILDDAGLGGAPVGSGALAKCQECGTGWGGYTVCPQCGGAVR